MHLNAVDVRPKKRLFFRFLVSKKNDISFLNYKFQDTTNLYMVLDFVPGGEMCSHLRRLGKFRSPL